MASYDEDTTSMGVEAARNALANLPAELEPQRIIFATANPAYLDKTNATAIHAALGLPSSVAAIDAGGAVRSGIGVMRMATEMSSPTLVVLSDVRNGMPSSSDEREGGDGAAAFVMARADVLGDAAQLRPLGSASASLEFLDRWRLPGERASHVWEERFGEHVYVPLVQEAFAAACKDAGITPDALDHVIVTGVHSRAVRVAGACDRRCTRRARRRLVVHRRQHRHGARGLDARGRAGTRRTRATHRHGLHRRRV